MHIVCSIALTSDAPASDTGPVRDLLASRGWTPCEDGFCREFAAGITSIDAPSIALHDALRDLAGGNWDRPAESPGLPARIACAYRGVTIFDETGVFLPEGPTPRLAARQPFFFSDLLRLRDKVLAVIQAEARKDLACL